MKKIKTWQNNENERIKLNNWNQDKNEKNEVILKWQKENKIKKKKERGIKKKWMNIKKI